VKKVKVEVEAYVFSDEETKRIVELLTYCKRRAVGHTNSGLADCRWISAFVDYMVWQLTGIQLKED
jgi:hypothetical protein